MGGDLVTGGQFRSIANRRLNEETCRKYGYSLAKVNGKICHVAPYRDKNGDVCGQKLRFEGKDFQTRGEMTNVQLFGQHLWKPTKRLVITEGEIDCLSYHQVSKTWPVCSIPNGAQSAKRAISRNIDWIEQFEEVCFMFDNDEQGIRAAKQCAELLTPGKATIASFDRYKDANEMLVANDVKGLLQVVYNAKPHRPDGVINGKEIWDDVSRPTVLGIPYPFKGFNSILFGIRPREIVTLTAGSGVGKSTIAAQIAYDLAVNQHKTIGYVALEESVGRTGLRFMSYALQRPLHLPQDITEVERKEAFDKTLGTGRFFLYDHFGSMDSDHLLNKLRFMVKACGADYLFIDHLSILLSGGDFMVSGGDERKQIDYTMSKLRQFTEETGVGMILISHLRRPSGDKGFEDGIDPNLSSLRGSQSIAQLSDAVLAVSRNASDGENKIRVRCLKNRYSGMTGEVCELSFNKDTGLLEEVAEFEAEVINL
jgi:twinkle protein